MTTAARRSLGFVVLGGAAALLGARVVTLNETTVVLALVAYLALIAAVWVVSRGNVLLVVLVAYLIGPAPADNLLPQVLIFPTSDYAVRPRDMFLLADVVLAAALLYLRPPVPAARLVRWWLGCLVALAMLGAAVGFWTGVGQSAAAVVQGAVMPLRGAGVVLLAAAWVTRTSWQGAIRDTCRVVVVAAVVLAFGAVAALIAARGADNLTVVGYPLVVSGRPALPGWGNNILANFACVAVAVIVCCGAALRWQLRWRVAAGAVLLAGIAATEVRFAMLGAVAIVIVALVLAAVRSTWPRRGGRWAVSVGVAVAVLCVVGAVIVLPAINSRYATLTPSAVTADAEQQSGADAGGQSASTRGKLVKAAGLLWWESPMYGVGWNGWGWGKSELPVMDPPPRVPLVVAVDPHNGLAWLLAETGIVGVLLLYLVPIIAAVRRGIGAWWVWAPLVVATGLELLNPNLRNGHFAAMVWALAALAILAPTVTVSRNTLLAWLRGQPVKETHVG